MQHTCIVLKLAGIFLYILGHTKLILYFIDCFSEKVDMVGWKNKKKKVNLIKIV